MKSKKVSGPKIPEKTIPINPSPQAFELAFQKRLGQTPLEWTKAKIQSGSPLDSIRYLYDICAAIYCLWQGYYFTY